MVISHVYLGIIKIDTDREKLIFMKNSCHNFILNYSRGNTFYRVLNLPVLLLANFFLLLDEMFVFAEEDEIIESLIF